MSDTELDDSLSTHESDTEYCKLQVQLAYMQVPMQPEFQVKLTKA